MNMELAGSLKKFPVEKVFQFLNMDSASGMLTLRKGKTRINIAMDDGNILDVEHTESSKEDRYGVIMISAGAITEEEFALMVEERKKRLEPIGSVLMDHGYLTKDSHFRLSRLIYQHILFEALQWKDGTYDFEKKDGLVPSELSEAISVASIMLNAARQEDEWPTLKKYVPNSNAIFAKSSTVDEEGWNNALEQMGESEQRIARSVDGISTIKQVADSTYSHEFEVSSVVAELVKRGLLVRSMEQEAVLQETMPKGFFSFRLGKAALIPLTITTILVIALFAWKNYISPIVRTPASVFAALKHGGKTAETVDRLRLIRVQNAFYTYLREKGVPPTSMAVLAKEGYCQENDLHTEAGGVFILQVLGNRENSAIIQGVDKTGVKIESLEVEIIIR